LALMAVLIFIVLLSAAYTFGRAWLVRSRVVALLESVGLHVTNIRVTDVTPWHAQIEDLVAGPGDAMKVAKISVDYSPQRLFHSRVDRIVVTGADLSSELVKVIQKATASESETGATTTTSTNASPVSTVEIESSKIRVGSGDKLVTLPIFGKVVSDEGRYNIALQADLNPKPLKISAVIHGRDIAGAIESEAFDIEYIQKILAQFEKNTPELEGWVQTRIAVAIQDGKGSIAATLKPQALNLFATNGSKLHLEGGTVTYNRAIAPDAPAGVFRLENVNVSSSSADFSAKDVNGTINVTSFAPFRTPPDQTITAKTLTSGKVELTDGTIVFNADDADNVIIQTTNWQAMGGTIGSENAKANLAKSSADFTVAAKDVELEQLLKVIGEGKVTGHGKVTGNIPLHIRGEKLFIGEGLITAAQGGTIQVADAKTISDTLAASDARFGAGGPYASLKTDLAQAMADFEYQTLRADFIRGENGISAKIHLAGRGRTGSKRAYDFEINVGGINDLLARAMGLYGAFEGK
jgi:hypothetical protein